MEPDYFADRSVFAGFFFRREFPARTLIHLSAGSSLAKSEIYLNQPILKKAIPRHPVFTSFLDIQGSGTELDTVLLKHLYSFRGGVMLGEIDFPNWHGHRSLEDIAVSYGTN